MTMTKSTNPSIQGSDWTRLLTDSDLVIHLPTLLKTYREVAPKEREAALLNVMRKIKAAALKRILQRKTVLPPRNQRSCILPSR